MLCVIVISNLYFRVFACMIFSCISLFISISVFILIMLLPISKIKYIKSLHLLHTSSISLALFFVILIPLFNLSAERNIIFFSAISLNSLFSATTYLHRLQPSNYASLIFEKSFVSLLLNIGFCSICLFSKLVWSELLFENHLFELKMYS